MNKSIVIILPKADWPDLQKMLMDTLGYKMQDGLKASNDGGKTWTHTYVRTDMEDNEREVLTKLRSAVSKDGKETVSKARADELRKADHRTEKTVLWRKQHSKMSHVDEMLAAKGLVRWIDPKTQQL